jgi:hypothetical protein
MLALCCLLQWRFTIFIFRFRVDAIFKQQFYYSFTCPLGSLWEWCLTITIFIVKGFGLTSSYASSSSTTASLPYSAANNSSVAPNLSLEFGLMSFCTRSSFTTALWLLLIASDSGVWLKSSVAWMLVPAFSKI